MPFYVHYIVLSYEVNEFLNMVIPHIILCIVSRFEIKIARKMIIYVF